MALEKASEVSEAEYLVSARATQRLARDTLHDTMDQHDVVVLVAPTAGPAWPIEPKDSFTGGLVSSLPAVAGTPLITLPSGTWRGLPLGVSLIGRAYSEGVLLQAASALEPRLPKLSPPRLIATVGVEVEGSEKSNTGMKDTAAKAYRDTKQV